jgi:hypothetical protein
MPLIGFLLVSVAIYVIPIWLLRSKAAARAQDFFVSSERTPLGVIRNSSIAYAVQTATFGTFFAWGASGDFWPAIIDAVCFGSGTYLIYILRRPILEFMGRALMREESITVHEFIARHHGNDSRVRLAASAATAVALAGVAAGAASSVASLLQPILAVGGGAGSKYLLASGLLILAILGATLSGNAGVMRSVQAQLGVLYLGLFGSTALIMYLLISALEPMPPHGTIAVACVAAFCAVIPLYRRSKFFDTSAILTTDPGALPGAGDGRESKSARLFTRFEKVLNPGISVFAVLVVVLASMQLYSRDPAALLRDGATALQAGTGSSGMRSIALFLLALSYPLVDITNWQRIAAFAQSAEPGEPGASVAFRSLFAAYAVETPLIWLFMCMLGAIAVAATAAPEGTVAAVLQQLASQQNWAADGALALMLVSVLAMALATMASVFSATLCAIRYDILPAIWPEFAAKAAPVTEATDATAAAVEATARRRAIIIGSGLYLAMFAALCLADAYSETNSLSLGVLALSFAFFCAQLSFVPLVLWPVIGRGVAGYGTVSPGWALAILGFSAAVAVGAAVIYLATGTEPWLWAAVPGCLGSSFLLFAIARLRKQTETP